MKVFLLSVLAVYVQGDCNTNCDACKDDHDIAKITCPGKGAECSIVIDSAYDGEEDLNLLLEDPKIKEITADGCRKKCKEQKKQEQEKASEATEDNECKFFHWQQDHKVGEADKVTTCSLQTSCQPSGYCDPLKYCVSGELGCNEECQTSLPCSLTQTGWDHVKFHVICTDATQDDGDVDIYSPDIVKKDIPAGTICNTIRKCSAWEDQGDPEALYYRELAVQCDGLSGTFTAMEDTGSSLLSAAMISGNTIVEQECDTTCDTITIPKLDEWADLVCDEPLEGNVLAEPNSCILLCDNHLRMTIDCKYVVAGDKKWQDAHGVELTDATIKC